MSLKNSGRKRIKLNSFFYAGAVITALVIIIIIIGFIHTPYSATEMNSAAKLQAPSAAHLMGTDKMGRDILSRVMVGAGNSFLIALAIVAIGTVCGTFIGALCGYYGGVADAILTRICDTITAFPAVLLALVIISITGGGSLNIILALGILFIPSFARVVRAEYSRERNANYVWAARLMGAGDFRIIFVHILPNTLPVLLPAITIGFNNAVLSEASMSFLGLGIQLPNISLGSMLNESQTYLSNAPWYAISSGCTIVALILGFSLLSEGLQKSVIRK